MSRVEVTRGCFKSSSRSGSFSPFLFCFALLLFQDFSHVCLSFPIFVFAFSSREGRKTSERGNNFWLVFASFFPTYMPSIKSWKKECKEEKDLKFLAVVIGAGATRWERLLLMLLLEERRKKFLSPSLVSRLSSVRDSLLQINNSSHKFLVASHKPRLRSIKKEKFSETSSPLN